MGENESDDDVPIAELLRRKQQLAANKARQLSNESSASVPSKRKRDSAPGKRAPRKLTRTWKESESEESGSEEEEEDDDGESRPRKERTATQTVKRVSESKSDYYSCKKGLLAQRLLVRWWYAMDWPPAELLPEPKQGFEALEGFPGVFISTREDTLGAVDDRRSRETKPCLSNLREMPSSELKQLCIRAYEEQIKQLIEAEGPNTALELVLRSELKEVARVDAEEADRESSRLGSRRSGR